jgi:hypothetical protein
VKPAGVKNPNSFNLNNKDCIYTANSEWKDGYPHGYGELIFGDGGTYTGYFTNGVINGYGRFISPQGWYYEG